MKKVTIIFPLILILCFFSLVTYVALSKDFTLPTLKEENSNQNELADDHPIWNVTIDDMAEYFKEKGMISDLKYTPISKGIATEARNYSGVEIYWWDVKHLDEKSDEYKAYKGLQENGQVDMWGSGMILVLEKHGPFGIYAAQYNGSVKELSKVYQEFMTDTK